MTTSSVIGYYGSKHSIAEQIVHLNQFEMNGVTEHADLAEALHRCESTVILSGYASPLYDEDLYADWHRHEINAWTGQGRAEHAAADGRRVEVLWSNRALEHEPHLLAGEGST